MTLKKRTSCATIVATLFATSAIPLHAETATTETSHQLLPVTVIGSKDNVASLAGSGAFIDASDIRTQNYDDINRVLRRIPGVYLREEDGFGLFPNISLRGVDGGRSSKITVMEDGVLAAPAPYAAPAAYYTPTPARMNAIEVLKGSSQIKYGPQTSGGVINYLSTPIPAEASGGVRALYGTNHELRNHLYYGDRFETSAGKVGYLLELYDRRTDGFKTIDPTPDFITNDRTGFRKTEPMLKLSWEPNTVRYQNLELKLGYTEMLADETYIGLSEEDFRADPYRRYAGSRFDYISTRMTRTHLRHQIELNEDAQLTTTAYYHEFKRNWFKERANGADVGNPERLAVLKGEAPGTLRYRNNNREYTSAGIESVLAYGFDAAGARHTLDLGIRLHEDEAIRFQRDDDFIQAANGTITDRLNGVPGGGGNREEKARAIALHLQDTIDFGRIAIIPGIRYEHVDLRYKDFDTQGDPGREIGRGDDTLDIFAPGIGLVGKLTDETSLFAGVYRGFSLPGPRAYAKDGIEEETSIGYEIGIRHLNPNSFQAELVFFYTDFDNLIVPELVGAGGTQARTENAGDVISYGAELKLAYDLGQALDLGFRNPWYLAATWTSAELDSDTASLNAESIFSGGRKGSKVPYIPEFQFLIGSGIETDRWGLYADLSYVDATYTTASNVNAPFDNDGKPNASFGKTDSRVVLDLSGNLQLKPGVKLIGSIHNLLDEDYLASRHPAGPRPGQPRTFLAGLEFQF
ncbi:MAG TPA: TonB-dependent receptor [Kiritimatiellia bacterium]|nr:TonB-dependent receptor [Kiritimatiellia bacterium]